MFVNCSPLFCGTLKSSIIDSCQMCNLRCLEQCYQIHGELWFVVYSDGGTIFGWYASLFFYAARVFLFLIVFFLFSLFSLFFFFSFFEEKDGAN